MGLIPVTVRLRPEIAALAPSGERRMGANPHANGGLLLRALRLPAFQDFAVEVKSPGATTAEATRVQGRYLAAVMGENLKSRNFRRGQQIPDLQEHVMGLRIRLPCRIRSVRRA